MKGIIIQLFGLLLLVTLHCSCVEREVQRNQITFKNSVDEVEKGILVMNNLLKKIPSADVSNYFFDAQGNLFINNNNVGRPDEIVLDKVTVLKGLSSKERKEFVTTATFLNKNKLSGCYLEGLFETWVYEYDILDDNSFRNYRGVFYQMPSTPIQDIIQAHEILDRESNLVLFRSK